MSELKMALQVKRLINATHIYSDWLTKHPKKARVDQSLKLGEIMHNCRDVCRFLTEVNSLTQNHHLITI